MSVCVGGGGERGGGVRAFVCARLCKVLLLNFL